MFNFNILSAKRDAILARSETVLKLPPDFRASVINCLLDLLLSHYISYLISPTNSLPKGLATLFERAQQIIIMIDSSDFNKYTSKAIF